MGKIETDVKNLVAPIAQKLGCAVVDVEFKKQPDGQILTVFIDKPNGVTLDDCEKVHLAIDAPLDVLDPTKGASYNLCVSSPGLDRDISSDSALEIAIGSQVDINLYSAIEKKKFFDGVLLKGFDKDCIFVEQNDAKLEIPRKQISKITKHINF